MRLVFLISIIAFFSQAISAQTYYNDYYDAKIDIASSSASFSVNNENFIGELITQQLKSNRYKTVYFVGSEDGLKTLAFYPERNFGVGVKYDNSLTELFVIDLPIKKAVKSAIKNWGSDFTYSMMSDASMINENNSVKNGLNKLESESSRRERLENDKKRLEIEEKRARFEKETNLKHFIGVYEVKIHQYGRSNFSALDVRAKLYVTEQGISLKGDFLTDGVIRGSYMKERAFLDFEEGVFQCSISKGFGDEMFVKIHNEKVAGSISRSFNSKHYDNITFVILNN